MFHLKLLMGSLSICIIKNICFRVWFNIRTVDIQQMLPEYLIILSDFIPKILNTFLTSKLILYNFKFLLALTYMDIYSIIRL